MTSRPSRYSRRTFVLSMAVLTAVPAGLARAQGMLDAALAQLTSETRQQVIDRG